MSNFSVGCPEPYNGLFTDASSAISNNTSFSGQTSVLVEEGHRKKKDARHRLSVFSKKQQRGPSSYIRSKFSDTITGILLSTRGTVLKAAVGLIHVAAVGKLTGQFSCVTFKLINYLDFLQRKGKSKVHPRTGPESLKGE